jgi:hypothetical protein
MPLETLFCDCKCGIKYERAVDEMTIILQTLDCNLPRAIVVAHNSEVFGDVRGRPRYEWTAPEDERRQPSFHLPRLRYDKVHKTLFFCSKNSWLLDTTISLRKSALIIWQNIPRLCLGDVCQPAAKRRINKLFFSRILRGRNTSRLAAG